ncbi:MAG: redoxin family protein [Bacteroidota bacterium]
MASKKVKKEIRDWAIFAGVLLILYFTGLHTNVAAFAQRMVLATGIANPKTEISSEPSQADYNFSLTGLDGELLDFKDTKGKVVFINFWATWCAPCIAEMPSIQELYDTYEANENVVFVMINVEGNLKKVNKFLDKKEYTFPVYFINSTGIPKVFDSSGIPATFVVDKDGNITYSKVGMANYSSSSFINYIENLAK